MGCHAKQGWSHFCTPVLCHQAPVWISSDNTVKVYHQSLQQRRCWCSCGTRPIKTVSMRYLISSMCNSPQHTGSSYKHLTPCAQRDHPQYPGQIHVRKQHLLLLKPLWCQWAHWCYWWTSDFHPTFQEKMGDNKGSNDMDVLKPMMQFGRKKF